jgi:hypothetical protein
MHIEGAHNSLLGDLYTNIQKWQKICRDAFPLIPGKKWNYTRTDPCT